MTCYHTPSPDPSRQGRGGVGRALGMMIYFERSSALWVTNGTQPKLIFDCLTENSPSRREGLLGDSTARKSFTPTPALPHQGGGREKTGSRSDSIYGYISV